MQEDKQMVYSAMRTPDGTLLESRHRHDYVTHTDAKTGETYMLDGGCAYRRMSDPTQDCEYIVFYVDDPIEQIREYFTWGTYGKNGDEPLYYKKLKDMTNEHVSAIIKEKHGAPWVWEVMLKELSYRDIKGIVIEDK